MRSFSSVVLLRLRSCEQLTMGINSYQQNSSEARAFVVPVETGFRSYMYRVLEERDSAVGSSIFLICGNFLTSEDINIGLLLPRIRQRISQQTARDKRLYKGDYETNFEPNKCTNVQA